MRAPGVRDRRRAPARQCGSKRRMTLGDPTSWVVAAGVFAAGVIGGLSGLGFAQMSAALLALVVDARTAILLLAITVPPMTALQAVHHRRSRPPLREFGPLLLAALIGVPIGVLLLSVLPARLLAGILGSVLLLYVVTRMRKATPQGPRHRLARLAPIVGFLAGVSNGSVGVSGPILAPYLLAMRMPPPTFSFTISMLFLAMNVIRFAGLIAVGALGAGTLILGGALLVPAIVGQRIGFGLQRRVSRPVVERVVLVLLFLAAVSLLVRALAGGV